MIFRRTLLLLFALLATTLPASVFAVETASESAVRAAMVFNFLKFTEWPAVTASEPAVRLCFAVDDPRQIAAFEALNRRLVRGKPLNVIRLDGGGDCDVIYVDTRRRWEEIIDTRPRGHALSISGYAGFAREGGMIEISLQEGSPRFDINLLAAKRAEVRFYPELLRLARRGFD